MVKSITGLFAFCCVLSNINILSKFSSMEVFSCVENFESFQSQIEILYHCEKSRQALPFRICIFVVNISIWWKLSNKWYAVLHYVSFESHSSTYCTFSLNLVGKKVMLLVVPVAKFRYSFDLLTRTQSLLVKMIVDFSCMKHVALGVLASI